MRSLTRNLLLAQWQRILQPPMPQAFNIANHCISKNADSQCCCHVLTAIRWRITGAMHTFDLRANEALLALDLKPERHGILACFTCGATRMINQMLQGCEATAMSCAITDCSFGSPECTVARLAADLRMAIGCCTLRPTASGWFIGGMYVGLHSGWQV